MDLGDPVRVIEITPAVQPIPEPLQAPAPDVEPVEVPEEVEVS